MISLSQNQLELTRIMAGGNFSINNSNSKSADTLFNSGGVNTNYSINPRIGYFVSNNIVVGLGIAYSTSPQTNNSYYYYPNNITPYTDREEKVYSNYLLTFSPFVRYYNYLTDKIALFFEGNAGYNFGKNKINNYSFLNDSSSNRSFSQSSRYGFSANILPGIIYFISKKFALEAALGSFNYTYNHTKDDYKKNNNFSTSSAFGLKFNLSTIAFGAYYYY